MLDQVTPNSAPNPIAKIENLRVQFETKDGPVLGVEDVSFEINPGETVCVVGESGSGKSVSSLSLMRLVEYGGGEIAGGRLLFDRKDGGELDLREAGTDLMRTIRGNEIGMIFQEPMTALNPVFTVGRQLTEGLRVHKGMSKPEAEARALELMKQVRIPEPEKRLGQYPHELSGGMRQRVVIAIALACEPRLLIADEPTTALDVTIQAEILALMDRLKRETGTAVMFITHDMAVVAQMADRVVVMFRGNKVEEGTAQEIFENPQHPYTKALLAAVPKLGTAAKTARSSRSRVQASHCLRSRASPRAFPSQAGSSAVLSPMCMRPRISPLLSTRAKPLVSLANLAAASQPWAARCCASWTRCPAKSTLAGPISWV
jgi:ABC-type dipeptide/oligopeptide/nickel transport system ATPase component